jgi:Rhomboid family
VWFVPLYDDNPIARTAVLTSLLIALCGGAFLWELGQGGTTILYGYGMIPAELFGYWHPGSVHQAVPAWAKVVTSMFLHSGWLHLIGNMMVLWVFGNSIEEVLGGGRPIPLFLLRDRGGAEPSLLRPGLALADGGGEWCHSGGNRGLSLALSPSECPLFRLDRLLLSHRQHPGLVPAWSVLYGTDRQWANPGARPPRGSVLGACRRLRQWNDHRDPASARGCKLAAAGAKPGVRHGTTSRSLRLTRLRDSNSEAVAPAGLMHPVRPAARWRPSRGSRSSFCRALSNPLGASSAGAC